MKWGPTCSHAQESSKNTKLESIICRGKGLADPTGPVPWLSLCEFTGALMALIQRAVFSCCPPSPPPGSYTDYNNVFNLL